MIGIPDPLNCKTFALKAGFLEAQVPLRQDSLYHVLIIRQ